MVIIYYYYYICIIIYQISPTCFAAYCTILRENSCHFLKTTCLLNVVTLVRKHKIHHMGILHCYLQLLEQYCLLVMP